jgi:hypothetical protein
VISIIDGSADAHAGIAVLREAYKRIDYNVELKPFPGKEALEQSNEGVFIFPSTSPKPYLHIDSC